MRVVYEYSHLGGAEILKVRYPEQESEINNVIANVQAIQSKISAEKTKEGRLLYDPKSLVSGKKGSSSKLISAMSVNALG